VVISPPLTARSPAVVTLREGRDAINRQGSVSLDIACITDSDTVGTITPRTWSESILARASEAVNGRRIRNWILVP